MSAADQLLLLAWLSPSFPIGAFAYSQGLETAVTAGDVHDRATLRGWLLDLLRYGSIRTDLLLAACAARALEAADHDGFRRVCELALALSPSRERHLETTQQGRSFMHALNAAWPSPRLKQLFEPSTEIAYPIAFAAATFAHRLKLRASLSAFAAHSCANLVSAVVRLGTIGQTDGQKVIASLTKPAQNAAAIALRASLDDLGSATLRADLASLRHETLYSRLFRS
ncbi:MAG: urease accessory protein UreF [Hyphomicrobiales bacterium]|nr:urease accessory protein UreF [Hyphomicrobiales bacterium]